MTTTTTNEFKLIGNSIKAAVSDMKNNSKFDGQEFVERLSELIKNECLFRGIPVKAFHYLANIVDVEKTFGISEYAWGLIADTL